MKEIQKFVQKLSMDKSLISSDMWAGESKN